MRFTRDIDRIRVKPRPQQRARAGERACEWQGCDGKGVHRAPKAPNRLREYRWFCTAHAREYNRGWNFFNGMSDEEIARYLKNNTTGHRPTWSVGSGPRGKMAGQEWQQQFEDTYNIFDDPTASGGARARRPVRRPPPLVRAALDSLGLDETATLKEVKVRYKELVKRFHPDANGGDRAMEGRLEQVIRAYNHLKASGIK